MITTFMLCDKCRIVLNALSNARSLLLIRQSRRISHSVARSPFSPQCFSLVHFLSIILFCCCRRRSLALSLHLSRFLCVCFFNSIKLQIFYENILLVYVIAPNEWKENRLDGKSVGLFLLAELVCVCALFFVYFWFGAIFYLYLVVDLLHFIVF